MKHTRLAVWGSLLILILALFVLAFNTSSVAALPPFTVTFVDVGQGDAAWLRTPDGMDILIDGGRYGHALQYLQGHGSPDIETMVASHPDADHIGGLVPILETLAVYQVVRDGQTHSTQTFQDFVDLISFAGIPDRFARWPESYTWGCCVTAQVLNPVEPLAFTDLNENSVVLRVSHEEIDFLFTGDIGAPAENDILGRRSDIRSEILKVSHHGSSGGSTADFLSAVQPETAVVSVGPNAYGHPSREVLERIAQLGAAVYRTDRLGSITVASNGSTYSISPSQTLTVTVHLPLILRNSSPPVRTPTPTATATSTPTRTSTLTNTPTATQPTFTSTVTPSPTPTPTVEPIATPAPTHTSTPTFTPTPTRTATLLPTSTPTPTATSTLAPADVQVSGFCSQFDAPGNDRENLNGEWVCFTNHGGGPADMTSWWVEDEANHTYTFPPFTLPDGATVRLHTGSGSDTQTDLYWGSGRAIWNNSGDTVFLYDAGGRLVDAYSY